MSLRSRSWTRRCGSIDITGVTLRGRIRLRDAGDDQTKVTFRLSCQVGRIVADSLKRLKQIAELGG